MIKGKAKAADGGEIVMLGITQENVDRLKAGQPIFVNKVELGIDIDIVIMFGKDRLELLRQMRPNISPETTIKIGRGKPPP